MVMDAEIVCRTPTDYAEMALRPLEAEQCVLVVIDIQQKLLPAIFQKEQLVRNAQLLIRAAAILKVPAVVSTQNAKGLGGTVPEVASLLMGTEVIDKTLFSCFGSDVFCSVLKRLPGQRNTLRTEWNWKIGLERMQAAGAVISSTEMMIYELMRSSSTAAFKELLPHLKG